MSVQDAPQRQPFPTNPEDFDEDDRISFSKVSGTHILETEDGGEFEFDVKLKRWIPVLDEAELERQRQAYAVEGVDESEAAIDHATRKRKDNGELDEGGRLKKTKKSHEPRERKNTAVYVTKLPLDIDAEEVNSVFSRCGVIAEEIDSGKPRIKLYTNDQDIFKGDALVVYFRPESVDLAIQLLDDTDFRLGQSLPQGRMRVSVADFSYKRQTEAPTKVSEKDKKKIIKRTQKLNNKLADWDDDDPQALQSSSSRWDKVVILKHMFTLQELEEDPAAKLDIKEDIREECGKLGDVTNVVLYDKETDGVASVRFSTPEAARACVRVMDGRFFAGTQVVAHIADGIERFKKTGNKKIDIDEDDVEGADEEAEEEKRLAKLASWRAEEEKEAKVDDET